MQRGSNTVSLKGLFRSKFFGDLSQYRHVSGCPCDAPLPGLGQGEIANVIWHLILSFLLSSGKRSGNAIPVTHTPEMALLASFPIDPINLVRLREHGRNPD